MTLLRSLAILSSAFLILVGCGGKKKGEDTVHMGFPSVKNWITSTDIEDEVSLKPLITAQKLFVDTIDTILE